MSPFQMTTSSSRRRTAATRPAPRRTRRCPCPVSAAASRAEERGSCRRALACGYQQPGSPAPVPTTYRRASNRLSRRGAVAEVNHAVAETAFVQQLELQADLVGEGLLAASHHDRRQEQV